MRLLAPAALLLLAGVLLAAAASAAPADADAKRLVKQAMTEDYLAMDFRGAEAKMKKAAQLCVEKGCGKGIHASVYRYLAVVYAVGLKDQAAAQFAFQNMLDLEPTLKPDASLSSPPVEAAFKAAQRANAAEKEAEKAALEIERKQQEESAKKAQEAKRQVAEQEAARKEAERQKKCEVKKLLKLKELPWKEQAVGYPVPIFVQVPQLPEGQTVGRVEVDFVAVSVGERNTFKLELVKGGWAGYIPCEAVRQKGEITYYVTAYNECGNPIATSGDAAEPHTVALKPAVEGKQPSLPGELPPEECAAGVATPKPTTPKPRNQKRDELGQAPRHRVGLFVSPDFSFVSSSNACSPDSRGDDGAFSCFTADGDYTGTPVSGAAGSFSTLAPGTMRLSVAYDHWLGDNLLLGARAGLTLFGRVNADQSFLPFHVDVRAGYYLGDRPFAHKGMRVGAYLAGGVGQASGRIGGVQISEGGTQEVTVWQRGGAIFVGAGLALEIPLSIEGAIAVDVGVRQHSGPALTSLAPAIGYVHGL